MLQKIAVGSENDGEWMLGDSELEEMSSPFDISCNVKPLVTVTEVTGGSTFSDSGGRDQGAHLLIDEAFSPTKRKNECYGLEMKVNGGDYSSFASSKSFEYPEEFTNVEHPQEPHDTDRPIRCPPPEPCIVHDGRIWKERMVASSRRRNVPLGTMRELNHIEYYSTPPDRHRRSRSSESLLVPPLIAPDLVVTKIID